MSDEQQPPAEPSESLAVTGPIVDFRDGPNGGKLQRGGNVRPKNPTPAEVSDFARKRLYQTIPELARIAKNRATREGKSKRSKPKRPYSTANQIRAIAELRMIAYEDRVPMSALAEALVNVTDDIREFLPTETAEALLSLIGPRFYGLRR